MSDQELFEKIQHEVSAGNVTESRDGNLRLYKYSVACVQDRRWNDVNRLCRGLVFRVQGEEAQRITYPFPKFFNLYEMEETRPENLPNLPFRVEEKLDGSCGIAFIDPNTRTWRVVTPGGLGSTQAIRATAMLQKHQLPISDAAIESRTTLLFEIIYPDNYIESDLVVPYGDRDELVLLTAFNDSGEWFLSFTNFFAQAFHFSRPTVYDYKDVTSLPMKEGIEGYVIRYDNGYRVKVKTPWYLTVQKLVGCKSTKRLVEHLRTGSELNYWQLPSQLQKHIDDVKAELQKRYDSLLQSAQSFAEQVKEISSVRKEQAAWIMGNTPPVLRGIVFLLLDGRDVHDTLWKVIAKELSDERREANKELENSSSG